MSVGRLVLALRDSGHDRGVDDVETLYAVYLACRIHYRRGVGGRAHLAGTDRVEVVEAVAAEILGRDHAGRFV